MKKLAYMVFAVLAVFSMAFSVHATTSGSDVEPEVIPGNPDCSYLGEGYQEYKIDEAPTDGTYDADGIGTITIKNADGTYFDWESTFGIDAVLVKGGPNANLYEYNPPAPSFGDTGLSAPMRNKSRPYGLSHVSFCYTPRLVVEKTANPAFDREYSWEITKDVDESYHELEPGESATSTYTVVVTQSVEDKNYSATGTITIYNPAQYASATIESVEDMMNGTGIDVDCGVTFPYQLAPGDTLTCTYSVDLDDDETLINTATVTTSGSIGGGMATTSVDFSGVTPTKIGYDEVTVVDHFGGATTTLGYATGTKTFTYPRLFTCDGDEGTHPDTATIVETGQSDDASVEVVCLVDMGCTLTPGYWMTHSEYGPAPYDDTWAELPDGADTPFFSSGKTYYEVLHTPPAGNVYYQLAFHYIAAELNVLNETSIPDDVLEAWLGAKKLFEKYTPAQVAKWRGGQGERREFIRLADILADYNEGITGPGHCDWEYDMDAYSAEASDTEYDDTMLMSISLSVEGDNLENSTEENTSEELEETGTDNMTEEEPIQNSGDPDIDTSSSSDEKEATDEGELVEAVTEGATEGVLDESADLTEEDSKDTSSDDSQSVAVTDEGEAESTEASVEESPEEKVEEKEERAPGPPAGRGNPKNR